MLDLATIKKKSEQYVLSNGGTICDWLPSIGLDDISIRDVVDVASRVMSLNILVNVSFGAPVSVARGWLAEYNMMESLSPDEKDIIEFVSEPDPQTRNSLRWNIECLWAAAWVGNLTKELLPVQEISDSLASWLPSLQDNEPPERFLAKFKLRTTDEIYTKLDQFYRSNWHTVNCQLTGRDYGVFHPVVVEKRRHMLEWVLHKDLAWNDVDLST